ncbi:hypothetical protein G7Y79_00001g001620 [Physcia stellaris]|nr:hypothetical protein G7Y79_00001g001620 [Physcia stellaris]
MEGLLDFGLCSSARSRGQATRHAKKREMREKHRQRITSSSSSSSSSCFRRFKSPSRKPILTVRNQPAKEHNSIQYTHDMNNAGRNYGVPFSTQRPTEDISSLKGPLRGQQLAFCKALQHEVIEQDREWLKATIDSHLEAFGRIKWARYQDIRKHLLEVLKGDSLRHSEPSYFQAFHDGNDEGAEAGIRSYIEGFRPILESEAEEEDNTANWVFLGRFKKRNGWTMASFLRKSFDHEVKLLKKSGTSPAISALLQEIRPDLTNIAVLRRRNTDNPCLQTLLEAIEKENHIAVSKSQHMYIESRMADIRANTS